MIVENAIRPTAINKNNWLSFGEENAGERGAIIHTVIESLAVLWQEKPRADFVASSQSLAVTRTPSQCRVSRKPFGEKRVL